LNWNVCSVILSKISVMDEMMKIVQLHTYYPFKSLFQHSNSFDNMTTRLIRRGWQGFVDLYHLKLTSGIFENKAIYNTYNKSNMAKCDIDNV
jgi:hypothetical protein